MTAVQARAIPHRRPFSEKLVTSFRKRRLALRRLVRADGRLRCRYFDTAFIVDVGEVIGYEIAVCRFEWREIKLMMEACRRLRPDVVLDVGANIGVYACILGRHRLAPKILAFEPDQENFAALQANVRLNGLTGIVEARAAAVGARSGSATLLPAGSDNRGLSRIAPGASGGYPVAMVALDDVLPLDGRTIVAKVDVEGYEAEVLAGAERLFARNGGFAQIEGRDDRAAALVAERMTGLGWRFLERYGLDLRFEKP